MKHNEINVNLTEIDEHLWTSITNSWQSMKLHELGTYPRYSTKIANAEELLPQCNSMRAKVSSAAILVFTTVLKVRSYRSSKSVSQKSCQSNNVLHTTKITYTNK